MLFELNGRTLDLSVEQVLRATAADFQYLVASQQGEQINDPSHGSVLRSLSTSGPDPAPVVVMDLLLPGQLDLEEDEVELAETLNVYEQIDYTYFED